MKFAYRQIVQMSAMLTFFGLCVRYFSTPPCRADVAKREADADKPTNSLDPLWTETRFDELYSKFDVKGVDCGGVLRGDNASMQNALVQAKLPEWKGHLMEDSEIITKAEKCEAFVAERGYITSSLSSMEENFPLAYSILAHKDAEAVERLLRAIYRPQNIYCIHLDSKSKEGFYKAVDAVSRCFDNVFMAPRRVDVKWGEFTVLEPELICLDELYKRKDSWRYFINLTGQEFPLKSNRELVEILIAYKGANDVEGVRRTANKSRWKDQGPVPAPLEPTKGGVHVVLNRDICDFIVHDPLAKAFLKWVRPQFVSDETFFSTIVHSPKLGIQGQFVGLDDIELVMERKPWFGRYKSWLDWPCAHSRVHDVCILSLGDLPAMHKSPFFFANKFYVNEDQVAYSCLEQRLFNHTRDVQLGRRGVDTKVYEDSIVVRNRLEKSDVGSSYHERGEGMMKERAKDYIR